MTQPEQWPNTLNLPDDVWTDVLARATAEQRSPYELLVEAWREYVEAERSRTIASAEAQS